MVRFISTWITVIVVFFILCLAWAIFEPIMSVTLLNLVNIQIWNNQMASGNNGNVQFFYASLAGSAKMIVMFFRFFPFALSTILLVWAVLSSLRKEEGEYYV